ncbi:MAG: GNAT family N-acetyltransferase [Candidatus Poribacteria bacterium]|nr:GNAT family N-acetyltransferase [Candidatus Poribacteria bacterium]
MVDQEFELTAKLQIRTITAKDAKDLQTYCFPNQTAEDIDKELKEDLARNKKGEVYRIVAEASGHTIGNIRLERSKADNELGEISQLTVSPPFRQFKVADKLIDVTEQIAEENGVKTLQIEFPKSENAIIAAYKGWGFAERPVVTLQKVVKSPEPESTTEEASEPEESPETSDDKEEQQKLL